MASEPDVTFAINSVPAGWTIVGGAAVLRADDAEGRRRMFVRYLGDFMAWEGLAAAEMLADDSRRAIDETAIPAPPVRDREGS